jgi:hypothetical protein
MAHIDLICRYRKKPPGSWVGVQVVIPDYSFTFAFFFTTLAHEIDTFLQRKYANVRNLRSNL